MISKLGVWKELGGDNYKETRFNLDWLVTHELNHVFVLDFGKADFGWLRRHFEEIRWGSLWLSEGQIFGLERVEQRYHYFKMTYNNCAGVRPEG